MNPGEITLSKRQFLTIRKSAVQSVPTPDFATARAVDTPTEKDPVVAVGA